MDNVISEEVKKTIMEQMGGKQVFHIKCNGEPIDTYDSEEEAQEHLDKYKQEHPGKELIIEPGSYESHEDMLEKMDQMGQELEEKDNQNMKQPNKFKSIEEAIVDAKNKGIKKIRINENIYNVDECYKDMEENHSEFEGEDDDDKYETCPKCHGIGEYKDGKKCGKCRGEGRIVKNEDGEPVKAKSLMKKYGEPSLNETEDCEECHGKNSDMYETILRGKKEDKKEIKPGVDLGKSFEKMKGNQKPSIVEKPESKNRLKSERDVNEEGTETMPEDKPEKGNTKVPEVVKESNKRTIRVNEAELVAMVKKMVSEVGIPGVSVTKQAQGKSGKENKANIAAVDKKIKDYLSIPGNNNPEFPKHNEKGDKVVVNNTEEENEYVEDFRGKGLHNLAFDEEPSKQFKERQKKSLEGDSTMGNEQESGSSIKTDTGKDLSKEAERKEKKDEEQPMYSKDPQPVKIVKGNKTKEDRVVNESTKISFSTIMEEEVAKMKKLAEYNKKTQ